MVGKKVKGMSIFLVFVVSILLLSSTVFAYPTIISESSINHTQAKQLVYSIPEEYYRYVDNIHFVNEPRNMWWDWNTFWFLEEKAWYDIIYDYDNNECYKADIYIYDKKQEYLVHELGHIYSICELKKPYNNETFAEDFIIG